MIGTKRTKKVISWLLSLAMVLTILPMSVFAAEPEVVKSYSVATLYSDGTLEIFADVSRIVTVPWQNERTSIIKVVFTVDTQLSQSLFSDCNNLTEITLPSTVTEIPLKSFNNCTSLTSITIPDSVTSIGERAFSDCQKLSSITFGESSQLQTIGIFAFNNCDALTSIMIPNTVTSIGDYAFNSCDALASIVIPDSVTSISNGAFSSCKALTSITIPDSVTSIDESAFYNCDALASITIPNSVTSIGNSAFYNCDALASITIPNSVTSIGNQAFYGCDVLTDIHYDGTVESWNSITKGAGAIPNVVKINHTGDCVDADTNHICDLCGKRVGSHADIDKNHICDYGCTEAIGTHAAASGKHTCDYCDTAVTTCTDFAEVVKPEALESAADCTNPAVYYKSCTVCGANGSETFTNGDALRHNYSYTASDNVITESCICGHSETATVTAPENPVYDGMAKEATVAYSDNWKGGALTIAYSDGGNVNAGSVTASIEKDSATASVVYEIAKATPIAIDGSVTKASSIRKNNKLSASAITGGKYKGIDDAELEGTYEWKEPDKDMNADGKEIVVFTPTDTNYKAVEIEVDVNVTTSSSSGGGGVSRYTVKFDTDGGTKIANKTVTRNSKLAEPEAPTKDGYTFNGWYTDEELTEKYDFDKAVTKGFTLYAKWDKHDDETPVTDKWVNPFEDVKESDWFFEDVKYANQNELMNGVSETEFAPNDKLTRAMLVTVLYRLEGEPATNRSIPFADVDMGAYYGNAVSWAKQNGIVNGVTETEFAPNDNITREQIAAIMHRYAEYKGYDVSVGEDTNILSYDDFDSISEYAIAAMQYACGSGLMKGKTASTLNPLDNATRAEIAAILHRFIEANK